MLPVQGLTATALIGSIGESQVTGLVTDLAATEKTANKSQPLGYAGLNGSSQLTNNLALKTQVPNLDESQITNLPADLAATEKTANKGIANGYPGLNASSQITNGLATITQLPSGANNQALKTNGVGTVTWGTFAGLLDTDTGEKQANKGSASGYAGLNASSQITNNLAAITQLPTGSVGQALFTRAGPTTSWAAIAESDVTSLQSDLAATEKTANKGVASGYAGLNGSSQITNNIAAMSQLPALSTSLAVVTDGSGVLTTGTTTASELGFVHGVTSAIQTQINGKANVGTIWYNRLNKQMGAGNFYSVSNFADSVTETNVSIRIPIASTWKVLTINVSSNSATAGTETVVSRKNAATGNQSVSISFGVTGTFVDNSNTDSLAQGDLIDYTITTNTFNNVWNALYLESVIV